MIKVMLAMCALGQLVNGLLGDRYGAKRLILAGMIGSAVVNLLFGFSSSFVVLLVLWGLNGYFVSVGWPLCVKTMANWFRSEERGRVMGMFGTCYMLGHVISWLLAALVVRYTGWRGAFYIPPIFLLAAAAHFWLRVRETPREAGLEGSEFPAERPPERAGLLRILRDTMEKREIWIIAVTSLLIGFVRWGFINWGITYIVETSESAIGGATIKMAFFPLLGCAGAIAAGHVSDTVFGARRGPVAVIGLSALALCILIFRMVPVHQGVLLAAVTAVIGFAIYGTESLLAGAAAQDHAAANNVSSATGFIDSFSYTGAVFSGFGTGMLIDTFGWNAAIYSWMVAAALGAFAASFLDRGRNGAVPAPRPNGAEPV